MKEEPSFLLLLPIVKYKREELDGETSLIKKEIGIANMGNSQPIQVTGNTKISRFTVKKDYSEKQAKGVAGQSFTKALKGLKDHRIQFHMLLFERLGK